MVPKEDVLMADRRFGRVNWLGLATLMKRELQRFVSVWTQTIIAPLVTAGLFMVIFSIAIGARRGDVAGMPFVTFIAPGILMMSVVQNAFANTSSSILIAKIQGNIVDTLMPPLSPGELLVGYLTGAIGRGCLVALSISIGMAIVLGLVPQHPLIFFGFVILGSILLGALGVIAAIFANKYDQMAAITNFVITPLAFLSGTFYSVQSLPQTLAVISQVNPVFYLIDGGRYGMIGVSDAPPLLGLGVVAAVTSVVCAFAWYLLKDRKSVV